MSRCLVIWSLPLSLSRTLRCGRRWASCALLALVAVLLGSCGGDAPVVDEGGAAVYFWRSRLQLSSGERAFLREHDVRCVYLKFFDVDLVEGEPRPVATLRFSDSLPAGMRIVPVVFITEPCLKAGPDSLAARVVRRVGQMAESNQLAGIDELQIDCDWLPASRERYFDMLTAARRLLAERGWKLSVTVRLHQLQQPPPPADYGVLMVYNTGDMRRRTSHNPILDSRDVKPYLSHLAAYPLPLCAAYPNYRWQLLFNGDELKGVLYDENLRDSLVYAPADAGDTLFNVVQARTLHGANTVGYDIHISPGEQVRVWLPSEAEVQGVARELEARRPGINRRVVVYHLDENSINNYPSSHYETLYHQ